MQERPDGSIDRPCVLAIELERACAKSDRIFWIELQQASPAAANPDHLPGTFGGAEDERFDTRVEAWHVAFRSRFRTAVKAWRSSRGQLILCDLAGRLMRVSGRGLELNDFAVLQVAESESARAGDEDVEDRSA
jgi:hypothetical protein